MVFINYCDFRFLDILHEAPLFGHRNSRSIFGSVVYFILLASRRFFFFFGDYVIRYHYDM